MALRDLRSNLATGELATPEAAGLTFGKGTAYDRPGQRFSGEPFIKEGLDFRLSDSGFNSVTDAFIRGGAVFSSERRLEDQRRIGNFLISSKGIAFIVKQIGLQKSNPKISEPSLPPFSNSSADHRTYNSGVNTLAQVVGQGTGLHVNREGRLPTAKDGYIDEENFGKNYSSPDFSGKSTNTNRLLYLFDKNISTSPQQERFKTAMVNIAGTMTEVPFADRFSYSAIPGQTNNADGSPVETEQKKQSRFGKFTRNIGEKIKAYFANPNEELYSYSGGPGSTYGIGKTNIYKYSNTNPRQDLRYEGSKNIGFFAGDKFDTNGIFNVKNILFEKVSDKALEDLDLRDKNFDNLGTEKDQHLLFGDTIAQNRQDNNDGYKIITPSRINNYLKTEGRSLTQTTKILGATDYNQIVKGTNSVTFHREERINLGSPGGNPDPNLGTSTVDLLNAMDVFKSLGGSDLGRQEIRDLVRFRIEAVDTDSPLNTDVMAFRAFLDSLNDNFSANYNEFNYNGRGESFFTYNSFNRGIDFSFKIAAQSSREMKPIYRKLNYLLSNTAPDYSNTSGRMRTPFVRVSIGAYLDRLPGVITGVTINWNKDYVWEIALDSPEDVDEESLISKGQFVLPHVLDVNVNFQPIHDFLPRKSVKSPFIIPSENSSLSKGKPERESWNNTDIANNLDGAALKINTINA